MSFRAIIGRAAVALLACVAAVGCRNVGRAQPCAPCEKDADCGAGQQCALVLSSGPDQGHAGRVCKQAARKDPGRALEPPTCPADCRNDCQTLGQCTLNGGACTLESDADCRASLLCTDLGLCSLATLHGEQRCWAKDDTDCAASKACREKGRCIAYPRETGLLGCGAKTDAGAWRFE